MAYVDEMTMEIETARLLIQELTAIIKHKDISEQVGIDLMNVVEGLKNADRLEITLNND